MQSLERQILESASLRNRNEILENKLEQANVHTQRLQLSFDDIRNKYELSSAKLKEIESAFETLNLIDDQPQQSSDHCDDDNGE
ncbi:hypothetical protein BLA29_015274, partial [Euroglyphus maynei]